MAFADRIVVWICVGRREIVRAAKEGRTDVTGRSGALGEVVTNVVARRVLSPMKQPPVTRRLLHRKIQERVMHHDKMLLWWQRCIKRKCYREIFQSLAVL